MTGDLNPAGDHLNTTTRSFRKRKSCAQPCMKYCLRKLQIHSLRKLKFPACTSSWHGINEYTITDAFDFAEEIRNLSDNEDDILVSYDVTALFTNLPLDETINILVNKAFADDWFNKTYGLNLQKHRLVELLEIATTNKLFQFDSRLYEQTNGVAIWASLLAS